MTATVAEISAALDANEEEPYGRARSVQAERLVELAAQTGDRPLLVRALQEEIQAHEYDGENDRILVPFARTLALWDDDPSAFDHYTSYTLHWHFKWVSGGMLRTPKVPLATIQRWTDEMATRYARAGYGMHAVHSTRHDVAAHIGDLPAAAAAFEAWQATDRDQMSDCHACDRNGQGAWHLSQGRPAEALAVWEPVLDGRLTCAEEPHRVLAKSLLALGRLGDWDTARAYHLRGYRMARRNPSLRRSVGHHLEFAALTGNEAYGLEILAEHAAWLTVAGETAAERLSFLEAVAVLLRRLVALGRADVPVPTTTGPVPAEQLLSTVEAEVADLGRRFDERNGTAAVSDRTRKRLAAEPLIDALALGAKAFAPAARSGPGTTMKSTVDTTDLAGLIAEADRMSRAHHPDADAAWERVAATGQPLPPDAEARIEQGRALSAARSGPVAARAAFRAVAERFAAIGDEARATVNRARAGMAAAMNGDLDTATTEITAAMDRIRALRDAGEADDDQVAVVAMCDVGARLQPLRPGPAGPVDDPAAWADVDRRLADLIAETRVTRLPYREGSARMTAVSAAMMRGDRDAAEGLATRAVEAFVAADAPWETAEPLALLARIALAKDDPRQAEEHLDTARRYAGPLLDAHQSGHHGLLRADAIWRQDGREAEVVDIALAAAAHLDHVDSARAAEARGLAAQAFHHTGRPAEAVALLELALPELESAGDEGALLRARRTYGQCLDAIGEHREAAKVLLAAVSMVQHWPDQTAHAMLAHDAATALDRAGNSAEATRAYQRAAEKWREIGAVTQAIRATRAQAWIAANADDEPDWAGARALMAAAVDEGDGYTPGHPDEEPQVVFERAESYHQLGQLLLRRPEADAATAAEGLAAAEKAIAGFDAVGADLKVAQSHLLAAEFEIEHLGRYDSAEARVTEVRRAAADAGDESLVENCDGYLGWITEQRKSAG